MLKIKNALKLRDPSKFQALYQNRNTWPPLADASHLLELSLSYGAPERDELQQWAEDMENPPFSLSQFEADWSMVTKDNIGIPYAIMDATDDWELRPDYNGLTYLMRAAQLRDYELIRALLRNCYMAPKSSSKSSSSNSKSSSSKSSSSKSSSSKSSSSKSSSSKSSSSDSDSDSGVSFFLRKDKKGLHALDYAVIAGGEIDSVIEFLEWVDIEDAIESSKRAKKSYFTKLDRFLKIIGLVHAKDRKWHRKTYHILRENIIQLIEEYDRCYVMKDLVAPDDHGYTGLMLVADTNLQEYDRVVDIMLAETPVDQIAAVDEDGFSALDYAEDRDNIPSINKILNALPKVLNCNH